MIKLYDYQTKAPVDFEDADAIMKLSLEGDRYFPIKDRKYAVEDRHTGEVSEILGQDLRQNMGSGKNLLDFNRHTARKQALSERSQSGQFLKSLAGEALTLGIADFEKRKINNPWDKIVAKEEEQIFGTARSLGSMAGGILPFLLGGLGGVIRGGASSIVKGVTKSALKGVGKATPSSIALKASLGASEKLGKKLAQYGGQSVAAQTALKAVGRGIGFAGVESAIRGTAAGGKRLVENIRRENDPKNFQGGEKASRIYDSVFSEGIETAGEVFGATALTLGVLGAGSKAVGLGLRGVQATGGLVKKGTEYLGMKSRQSFLNASGDSFFNNRIAKRNLDNLKKAFDLKKEVKPAEVMRTTARYVENLVGKASKDKTATIGVLNKNVENIGKSLGDIRNTLAKKSGWLGRESLNKELESLKKIATGTGGATNVKSYIGTINRLQKFILATKKGKPVGLPPKQTVVAKEYENKVTFRTVKDILNILDDKAKFQKGAEPTELNKIYRTAYSRMTDFENRVMESLVKNPSLKGTIQNLKQVKKNYQQAITVKNIMDKGIQQGWGLSNVRTNRELLYLGALALGAGAVAPVTALGGAIGVSIGQSYVKTTGRMLLNTANHLDKVHGVLNKAKTPKGVNNLLNSKIFDDKPVRVTTKALGDFFGLNEVKDMEDFTSQLSSKEPLDRFTSGQDDIFQASLEYGGEQPSSEVNRKLMQMKVEITKSLPKPFRGPYDIKPKYDKKEVKAWEKNLEGSIHPSGFVKAVREGRLSLKQFSMFSKLYPNFLAKFNISLLQGLSSGMIPLSREVKNYLALQKQQVFKDMGMFMLDQMSKEEAPQGAPKRKFNPKSITTASQSEQSQSGVMM